MSDVIATLSDKSSRAMKKRDCTIELFLSERQSKLLHHTQLWNFDLWWNEKESHPSVFKKLSSTQLSKPVLGEKGFLWDFDLVQLWPCCICQFVEITSLQAKEGHLPETSLHLCITLLDYIPVNVVKIIYCLIVHVMMMLEQDIYALTPWAVSSGRISN